MKNSKANKVKVFFCSLSEQIDPEPLRRDVAVVFTSSACVLVEILIYLHGSIAINQQTIPL